MRLARLPSMRMRYDKLSVMTPSELNGPSAPASAPDSVIVSRPHAGEIVSFKSPPSGFVYDAKIRKNLVELLRSSDVCVSGSESSTCKPSELPHKKRLSRPLSCML